MMTPDDLEAIADRLDALGDTFRDQLRVVSDSLTPKLSDRAKRTSGRAVNPVTDERAS